MGSEPQVYAESILKVCEFYLASPVPCAAGVTGGELKKRIEGIMANRFGSKLGFGKRALLAMAALVSVLSPLAIGVMHPLHGAQEQAQRLTFEVASFKLAAGQGIFSSRLELHPGRFTWTTQLCYLFGYAYDLEWGRFSSVSGHIPGWGDVYDVAATMSPKATEDQIRLMVRSLLEDRMKMAWHFETKRPTGGFSPSTIMAQTSPIQGRRPAATDAGLGQRRGCWGLGRPDLGRAGRGPRRIAHWPQDLDGAALRKPGTLARESRLG